MATTMPYPSRGHNERTLPKHDRLGAERYPHLVRCVAAAERRYKKWLKRREELLDRLAEEGTAGDTEVDVLIRECEPAIKAGVRKTCE